jgi:hypothetical protein
MQDLSQVNTQLTRKDLFEAFKVQLAKDFEQSNFSADFVKSLEPDYARIHGQILLELQRAQKRADSDVMNLLYRVDISEAQLKRYLAESQEANPLITIAELVIKRVLQKVVIRKYYKSE